MVVLSRVTSCSKAVFGRAKRTIEDRAKSDKIIRIEVWKGQTSYSYEQTEESEPESS